MPDRFTTLAWVLLALAGLFAASARADDPNPEPGPTWPKTTAAHRKQSQNNLKQIGLAFHNHLAAYKYFPAAAAFGKGKKPLLSWRVALLPYIEEDALYKKFKLDEPWDSPHNKKLLPLMPKIYAPAISGKPAKAGHTYYQVFTGKDTPFDPRHVRLAGGTLQTGPGVASFPDGFSNTALVVEAGEAVPWTKPQDVVYDPKKAIPKLGGLFKEGFHVLIADGSIRVIGRKATEKGLRMLIMPADGMIIDDKDLPGPETKK